MFKFLRKNKKGFTLTELIVVVAILGVLAAVVTPMIMNNANEARQAADRANASTIENTVKRLVARGTIDLATATEAQVITAIEAELNPIPVPQETAGNVFGLNRATARVTAQPTFATDGTQVNLNP
ncbi:MAG: prepilin-type N-terminal cleavage/methylation domain-containing protein [Clostridia bacterium]|nr:prepilin-type N-terminal cleavage/methylation domain-containing protein [Clostridia bacterium]